MTPINHCCTIAYIKRFNIIDIVIRITSIRNAQNYLLKLISFDMAYGFTVFASQLFFIKLSIEVHISYTMLELDERTSQGRIFYFEKYFFAVTS